jgi:hypothetical protein
MLLGNHEHVNHEHFNPSDWILSIEKKVKFQSRIWRQLRNHVVGQIGAPPEMLMKERVDSLKSKAREQVRDLIESSLSGIENVNWN